jgi:uncharacterized phage protein (TIGR01671 family)
MRDLKFRAWDREKKEMLFIKNIWVDFAELGQEHIDQKRNLHVLNIMQYTGLKDKRGKEIYEGDIILFTRRPLLSTPNIEKIIISDLFEFLENKGYDEGEMCDEYSPENLEVIGNVYENPEVEPRYSVAEIEKVWMSFAHRGDIHIINQMDSVLTGREFFNRLKNPEKVKKILEKQSE